MLSACCLTPAGMEPITDPEDISELVGRDGRLVWVDIVDPTPDDLACIEKEFELHPLAVEDAVKHGQRPKLERYPTHAFLVAYSAAVSEVDVFIGPAWLVTVRERNAAGEAWSPDPARARLGRRTAGQEVSVGEAVHVILDDIVDGYFSALDATEDRLEEIEDRIFAVDDEGGDDLQQQMFAIRRELLRFRRAIVPLREVVSALLRREVAWVEGEALVSLQDVYDHVLRAADAVDAQRELLGNAVDAHLAQIANRQNRVMKRMTSWGAILLGATLVAGIYGMNFEHMPELDWLLGYPFALGLMMTVTVTGYLYFRRKGWL